MNTLSLRMARFSGIAWALLALTVLLPLHRARAAGVRYAKPTATGSGDCSSWANACTLQTALTGAVSGDEIWVMAGTYKPTTTPTARTATFQLVSGVAVYGGFDGTESTRDARDPDANLTILSGDIDNNDSQTPIITNIATVTGNATNSYHVVTSASSATLDGVTITAGNANDSTIPNNYGGGMYNNTSGLTLTNVTFSGNSAIQGGGMMNFSAGTPALTNVTFSGNSAGSGGGLYNAWGAPILMNVTFSGNSATNGGGVYNSGNSQPQLTNVTFSGNSVTSNGGGMYTTGSVPTLTNVTFSGNSATSGGGMYTTGNVIRPTIRNSIFWGNTGGEIINFGRVYPTISDSVLQGYVSCWVGSTCTNIITTNPYLGTLGDYGGPTATIPLQTGSSAIDRGNASYCPTTDQRGATRPTDGDANGAAQCDIGAFEVGGLQCGIQAAAKPAAYTFLVNVSLTVTGAGTNLDCLRVSDIPWNHPQATSGGSGLGIQTGKYWIIDGLQSDKSSEAAGDFSLNLTLPHSLGDAHANAKVCKYPGTQGGYGWDCFRSGSDTASVWLEGISSLSDWAMGDQVGPTAIHLQSFATHPNQRSLVNLVGFAGLLALFFVGVLILRKSN